ncbi:hypothetical protein LM010_06500 [Lacticaseibacillus manihotivorans]|uniref:Uncharacterized protein n=1 Tax=Lacticaseibacillus manihotivorans TaxID=88233 RepID=A0A5P8JPP4_9LACO|nr:hypothetical protein [Lacticaseibacillus manihotivorans]QFQ91098.1 hypothetical protein LM010_06500 [Lacticaseibacillus manihotivorans]
MLSILAIGLPILFWIILLVIIGKFNYRHNLLFWVMIVVNFLAIWQLTQLHAGTYLWACFLASIVAAILVVMLLIINEHDVFLRRYTHLMARVEVIATTCWWIAAIFFQK